jgi:hypothetical protein
MADKDKLDDDFHGSFADLSYGVGQKADGTIDTFPASELAARIAARDADEEATTYAIEDSELQDDDLGDLGDLDELDDLLKD